MMLLEACAFARIPYPVTETELYATFAVLDKRGIKHNLTDEPAYARWQSAARVRVRRDVQAVIRKARAVRS